MGKSPFWPNSCATTRPASAAGATRTEAAQRPQNVTVPPSLCHLARGNLPEFRFVRPRLSKFRFVSAVLPESHFARADLSESRLPRLAKRHFGRTALAKRHYSRFPLAKRDSDRTSLTNGHRGLSLLAKPLSRAVRKPCPHRILDGREKNCISHPPFTSKTAFGFEIWGTFPRAGGTAPTVSAGRRPVRATP